MTVTLTRLEGTTVVSGVKSVEVETGLHYAMVSFYDGTSKIYVNVFKVVTEAVNGLEK